MMTVREAWIRAGINKGKIKWLRDSREYRVTLEEWRGSEVEDKAYYTHDLEDAVLTLGSMRRTQDAEQALRNTKR